jgi:hypothetical protein
VVQNHRKSFLGSLSKVDRGHTWESMVVGNICIVAAGIRQSCILVPRRMKKVCECSLAYYSNCSLYCLCRKFRC